MNSIAAHKGELKKLVEGLIGRHRRRRDDFHRVPGCLYRVLRYELLRHQVRVIRAAQTNGELTWNQH
jgi:hypothetical protein